MANILCITSGLTGILNASFELVARLQTEGHQLAYASPAVVGQKVREQGIDYHQLPAILVEPGPELPSFRGPLGKLSRLAYKFRHAAERRRQALAQLRPEEFGRLIETLSPDLLIVDVELHEYIIWAHQHGQPMLLLSQWFSLWNRPGLPYLLHDTIPGQGKEGSPQSIASSWRKIRRRRSWTFWKRKMLSGFTDRRTVLLDFAKEQNFPLELIKDNYWPGPFTYDQLPVISMTAQEMEFPHDLRPNLHYVGPMVRAERKENTPPAIETSIGEVLSASRAEGQSILYCSVSTLHAGDAQFIAKIIEAVRGRSDWSLIIGMGGLLEEKRFGELPSNVHAYSYVPQLKVLAQANLSINHGGIHTINECIHFQVPMLVYSGKRSDQNGCAARVAYHRLGLMADKDVDGPQEIRQKIDTVLKDAQVSEQMAQLHRHYLQYQEERRLQKTVAKLLSKQVEQKTKLLS